jgi:hypothetical protein
VSHNEAVAALEAKYALLERSMSVLDSPRYASLVVPNGNQHTPIHRWFHLKEAYSSFLLEEVLRDIDLESREDLRVLDPFAGVGTTCLSVGDHLRSGDRRSATAYGFESNGFLHLVAETKLASLQAPARHFDRFARSIRHAALNMRDAPPIPSLSTFHDPMYFEFSDLAQLMKIKAAIDEAERIGAEELHVALARVCLGAIIEPVSNLRRDGRALRYTEKRSRPAALQAFTDKADQVSRDMPEHAVSLRGRVFRGDGRQLERIDFRSQKFNLVLFSPPYPNNIDYTEVYKLENWLLGFINDGDEFAQQRRRTVYSHPSILRDDPLQDAAISMDERESLRRVTEAIVAAVPSDRYSEGRRRMLQGYAVDMYLTLRSVRSCLDYDGWVVYVVGNSVHGHGREQLIIAADLFIGELARLVGFRVERVAVARHLRRRFVESPFLRESVVFLRRADTR